MISYTCTLVNLIKYGILTRLWTFGIMITVQNCLAHKSIQVEIDSGSKYNIHSIEADWFVLANPVHKKMLHIEYLMMK